MSWYLGEFLVEVGNNVLNPQIELEKAIHKYSTANLRDARFEWV